MSDAPPTGDQPVAVVTGGGGGIGAAIAEALGREGWHIVTVDPLVSLDGAEQLPAPETTTAGRITAGGGSARASAVSVTDGPAVRGLFDELVAERGRLDAVVNVAGISRPTSFAAGREEDWHAVLSVHLDGYRNVLEAALPIMAAAGRGRILGVTSGSGWRQADAGAYGCAKRAVAALTWELGRAAPDGVVVNAVSPIAVTRMVTEALARTQASAGSGGAATGGLSLGTMPAPEQLGPLGAYLVSDAIEWCRGSVLFAGGSEVAVIEEPRLLEVVRTDGASRPAVLEAITLGALGPAEVAQASGGGRNPRFGPIFDDADPGVAPCESRSCVLVTDRPDLASGIVRALAAREVACDVVDAGTVETGFARASEALGSSRERAGPFDAVVVALAGARPGAGPRPWERVLSEHAGLVGRIMTDAGWARAVADLAASAERPIRLVTLTDALTSGGRSRAQAAAELARAARRATDDRVAAFSVSVEAARVVGPLAELAAHLVCSPEAAVLAGAELVVADGWLGLRSHPRPSAAMTFGGPDLPGWFDGALRALVGASPPDSRP